MIIPEKVLQRAWLWPSLVFCVALGVGLWGHPHLFAITQPYRIGGNVERYFAARDFPYIGKVLRIGIIQAESWVLAVLIGVYLVRRGRPTQRHVCLWSAEVGYVLIPLIWNVSYYYHVTRGELVLTELIMITYGVPAALLALSSLFRLKSRQSEQPVGFPVLTNDSTGKGFRDAAP